MNDETSSTTDRSPLAVERANTILYCGRWAETVDFYRRVLGAPASFENDWFVEFPLGDTSFVSVADARRATIEAGGGAGLTLSWRVADVGAARAALAGHGVEVSPVVTRWGAVTASFHDPDGHRIEIWSPATR